MKKLHYAVLLFLMIAAGCQKEDDAHVHRHEESGLKMQKITLEEMKSKPLAVEALNRVKVNKGKGSQQAKLLYDSNNDFYVDTDEIIYIEKDQYHSFTLAVYRDHNAPFFENLVMSLQKDGSYSATLVSYDLTEQEKADLESERLYSLEGKVQATVLNGGSMTPEMLMSRVSCIYITVPTCSYGTSVHFAGSGCTQVDGTYTISVCTEEAAPVYYISGPGGGSPSPGSSGPVGGSGTSPVQPSEPSPGNPTPITEPDLNSPQEPEDDFEDAIITVPLIKSPKSSPCQELIKLTNNTNIKDSYTGPNGLMSKVDENKEYGFAFSRGENYDTMTEISRNINKPNELNLVNFVGGSYIGASHTHPHPSTGTYPMFAPHDLKYLGQVAVRHSPAQPRNYSEYVLTLTVPQGTFAIKIKDPVKYLSAISNKFSGQDGIEKSLKRKFFKRKTTDNLDGMIKDLLEIFRDFDMGGGLYQANSDFSVWSEITLDLTGQLKTDPCN